MDVKALLAELHRDLEAVQKADRAGAGHDILHQGLDAVLARIAEMISTLEAEAALAEQVKAAQ